MTLASSDMCRPQYEDFEADAYESALGSTNGLIDACELQLSAYCHALELYADSLEAKLRGRNDG